MKLQQIPQDKANHFIYGLLICFISSLFFSSIIALSIVIIIGVVKEIYDKISNKGNPELLDLIFTGLGGLIIFLTREIIKK